MEQTETLKDDPACRYTGTVERLCRSQPRGYIYGYILAANGDRLAFRRVAMMGQSDPHPWRPAVGAAVLFDRELRPRGPWAVKVRPIDSRRLPTASAEPVAGLRAR